MSKLIKSRGDLLCVNPNEPREICYSNDGRYWKRLCRFDDRIVDILDDDGAGLLVLTSGGELFFSENGDYWKRIHSF